VVLVMALILMGLLSALAGGYALLVRADTVLSGGASRVRNGFYAAEAGLNVGMAEFANIFKNYGVPDEDDYEERTLEVGNRTVNYQLAPVPGYDPCTEGEDEDCYTTIPAGEKFAGLKTIPYRYTVQSTSVNGEGDEEAELGAEFDIHNIPIFQFLAFYWDDLYIMPLPDMDLHGRIHTNGDLRLNCDALLTIGDDNPDMPFVQISAGGKIYRGAIKYGANKCNAQSVQIDKLEDTVAPSPDYDPLLLEPCDIGTPVPQATLDSFKGSILDDVDSIELPPVDIIARGDGIFWQRADLRIVLRLDLARAEVDFGAANLCPNGPPNTDTHPNANTLRSQALYPIEVQNADGSRDSARTTALWRLMCERRGTIFYTDVPNNPPTPPANNTVYANTRTNYTPNFPDPSGNNNDNNDLVYRRAGEDTSGDGLVNNGDRNDDICPVTTNAGDPVPWWRPSYCDAVYGPWPNLRAAARSSSWYRDTDYRRGGFYNHRESQWMYLLNVNMRALIDWNERNGGLLFSPDDRSDWGLVIFLSVQGPNSDAAVNNYGVRIFDSADLNATNGTFPPGAADPSGLTVASDQAIYVQGNYNSRDKYPAAVIGDALNVLSQGWEVPRTGAGTDPRDNDRKSAADLSTDRRDVPAQDGYYLNNLDGTHTLVCAPSGCASFTGDDKLFINAAFIAGLGPSPAGEGNYDGGLENYPRFHESWTSRTLNIRGSFVSLGRSQHAVNNWACGSGNSCNIYDPPERPWDYDADFNFVEKLPPLTPKITYVQQRLYTRFYK
jgi:hypothetical protein